MKKFYYFRGLQAISRDRVQWLFSDATDEIYSHTITDNCAQYEKLRLQYQPFSTSVLLNKVSSCFEGSILSSTQYNPGQRYYYSPVGLIFVIEHDNQVLANFKADGNVGDACDWYSTKDRPDVCNPLQRLCTLLFTQPDLFPKGTVAQKKHETLLTKYKENILFITPEDGIDFVNALLSQSQSDPLQIKAIKTRIEEIGRDTLRSYYEKKGNQFRYTGYGFTKGTQFTAAEQAYCKTLPGQMVTLGTKEEGLADEGLYTESVIQGTPRNLGYILVSLDRYAIPYAEGTADDPIIDSRWIIKGTPPSEEAIRIAFMARLTDALELYRELNEIQSDLKFAILNESGFLLLVPNNISDIEALILICEQDQNWQNTLILKLKTFPVLNSDAPSAPSADKKELWRVDPNRNAIKIVKSLSLVTTFFQTELSFQALYATLPPILQMDIMKIFRDHSSRLQTGSFSEAITDLNRLRGRKYRSDQLESKSSVEFIEITKIITKLRGSDQTSINVKKDILALLNQPHQESNPHRGDLS